MKRAEKNSRNFTLCKHQLFNICYYWKHSTNENHFNYKYASPCKMRLKKDNQNELEFLDILLFLEIGISHPIQGERWFQQCQKRQAKWNSILAIRVYISNKLGVPQKPKKQYYFIVLVVFGGWNYTLTYSQYMKLFLFYTKTRRRPYLQSVVLEKAVKIIRNFEKMWDDVKSDEILWWFL